MITKEEAFRIYQKKQGELYPQERLPSADLSESVAVAAIMEAVNGPAVVLKKPCTMYLHNEKESNYSKAEELGLTKEQTKTFMYTGLEVKFEGYVDETGKFWAQAVNGTKLVQETEV